MDAPREGSVDPPRRWPPSAAPQRLELPIGAVLGIFLVMEVVRHLAWNYAVGRPFSVVGWEWDPTITAVSRQLIANSVIQILIWLALLTMLGWGRAAGLGAGSVSSWGVVPLALFWAAALMAAGLTHVISKGGGFIALAVVGVFLDSLNQEIAFRGFLFHGLTRRAGGTIAVLLGSALFALVHLPVEIAGYRHETPVVLAALLMHFCFGVVMCRIRAETGAVWFPTGVHALNNLTIVAIGIWASPAADPPMAFLMIRLGLIGTGLLLTLGLVTRRFGRELRANIAVISRIAAADRTAAAPLASEGPGSDGDPDLPGHVGEPSHASPFARFTQAARLAVVCAHAEALEQGDRSVGTEHLLLGLIAADRDGNTGRALERAGVSLNRGVAGADPRVEHDGIAAPRVPFAPRAKLALVVAIREADRLGHVDIGPEHVLLGIVAERDGEAVRVLRRIGTSPERVRRAVIDLLTWRDERAATVGSVQDSDHPVPT